MDFKTHLKKYLNDAEIDSLINSFSLDEKKALFLNTEKMDETKFIGKFPNVKKHPIVPNGFIYDKNEYEFGKYIYHDLGAYYIQEPSAMIVAHLLDAKSTDLVLDLCAAPGGKTIQTALKMQNKGMIIANDLSKTRANILLSNIERLGISNTVVTSLDFSKQYNKFINFFDKIILDAPCSGSGMFRKSSEMKADWTYEKVVSNAKTQKELIKIAYEMLKPGGTLVYSTCSCSFEEDEEVVESLLENYDAELVNIPSFEGEFRSKKYSQTVHLFPSHFEGEGHYIALIKKPGVLTSNKFEEIMVKRQSSTKGGIKQTEFYQINHKLPKGFEDLCLRPGLFMSTFVNGKYIPSHHASHAKNDLDKIELNIDEAIKYIHGETLNKIVGDGYYVVTYENMDLGSVHVVNNSLKNLYPKGLRNYSLINR